MRIAILLLSIALVTACQYKSRMQFELMDASETGLSFRNEIVETEENNIMTYQYMYNGAGIAAGDINNDGLCDLYVAGNSVANKLFLNKVSWKFEDATSAASLIDRKGDWKTGVTMADVNGDGWLDIYLCYSGNTTGEGFNKPVVANNPRRDNQLFINNGCKPGGIPTFTESANEYGLAAPGTFSTQSYFFDYDRDGDLDMFLLNHGNTFYSSMFNTKKLRNLRHPFFGNKLYRNENNHFAEISAQAGIHGSGLNYGLSAAISDLNNDGWPDIYVTNDYDEQDFLYLNNKNGTFSEVSQKAFGHISKYSMGSDIADINNDGRQDLFVVDMLPEDNRRQKLLKGPDQYDKYMLAADSGYHYQNMRNTLQMNCGMNDDSMLRFAELGQMAGLSNTDWSWAPLFVDFDNDGFKDVFITNGYLRDYTNMDFLKFAQEQISPSFASFNEANQNWLALIQKMQSTKLSNYAMRNTDGLHFENKTSDWGIDQKSISNGTAYADFDNDGDLDIVVNNLNEPMAVYKNDVTGEENSYIKIKLAGNAPNTYGIGARVHIIAGNKKFYHEAYYGRGYESSVEPVLTIGLGEVSSIDEIKVVWPDGKQTLLRNVPANQSVVVSQQQAVAEMQARTKAEYLLTDVFSTSGIHFRHTENDFVDFKIQRLIPYQASRLGARLAVADVDNDGNDDVYFGGAVGQSGGLFLGRDDGTFAVAPSQPWQADAAYEDVGATFFDADSDGDNDLYVVSGGNEYGTGDPMYHDRIYVNDGNGSFATTSTALPAAETTSGSCVIPGDFDKDGDVDLFVGGRIAAQMYPMTPKSFVLRNDSREGELKFTDVTKQLNSGLQLCGMVTDANWSDLNNDGWLDLIVAGEWMPVRVFENAQGKSFREVTGSYGLAGSEGWWSTVFTGDIDGDGDVDILVGNAGSNLQYRASKDQPLEYVVQDINGDGVPDPIMCYSIQGKSYPAPSLDELVEQVPGLRKKFYRYADYADATIEDVMDKDLLDAAFRLRINTLQSSWIENLGNGKFSIKVLPHEVQTSMINGFVSDDFDGDRQCEVLAAGNFYPYKVEWGRSDAFMGALLKFRDGKVMVYRPEIPLWLTGDIRSMKITNTKAGKKAVIVSRNDDAPGVFQIRKAGR